MAGDGLSAKQQAALIALLQSPSIEAAAAQAKVSSRAIHKWFHQEAFKRAFREARKAMVDQAVVVLQQAAKDAVEALKRNLNPPAPPGVQVSAAKEILDKAIDAQTMADMQAELEELREMLAHAQPGGDKEGTGEVAGGDRPPDAGDEPGTGETPERPDPPVPGDGVGGGPVAGGLFEVDGPA